MKWIKNIGLLLVLLVFASLLVGVDLWFFYHPKVIRTDGVIYGHRPGKELTMDIIRPEIGSHGVGSAVMASG